MERRIVIRFQGNAGSDELESLLRFAGIVSERDVDSTVVEIMRNLIQAARNRQFEDGIRSGELAKMSGLNRITCIHHLQRLEKAGLVEKDDEQYELRWKSFSELMREMEEEAMQEFKRMEGLARRLDEEFKLLSESSENGTKQPKVNIRRLRIR